MPRIRNSFLYVIAQYLLAGAFVAVMTLAVWVFHLHLGTQIVSLLYLIPVILSTALWGLGPGILASLLAFITFNYFFIPPYYTLNVHQAQDLLALLIFLLVAVVISQLLGRAQAGIAAAKNREREATRLYELSIALAGLQDANAIMATLARQIDETFEGERVEILLNHVPEGQARRFVLPVDAPPAGTNPRISVPLSTARGLQGTIHLWREGEALTFPEERLLRTYASQGALALERAYLVDSTNRAKVLEESDRLKTAILSSVSHELRSPLATIKASITSLSSGTVEWDSDAGRELLAAIEEETDHLNQLVGNLLDMSRLEVGALLPQRKWNSLSDIVGSVLQQMRKSLLRYKIIVDIPVDLPLVPVDFFQMERVFSNLLSNSVKYAPENTEIHIQGRPEANQTLLVELSNQSPPVDEEHLSRIFDKFYRVTAADRITGTGLGLSICKGIIEAHGGKIWAENKENVFIFKITLPLTWEGELPHLPEEHKVDEQPT
ncbi:MAG: DUF4118 domain-containing protein [Chloroflexi bacterium]|nr:DUF4118 domain-containing protein [Chloroflexota bacterium]